MTDTFMNARQVAEKLGLSRSTIHRMVSEGRFPKPLQVSHRAVRWKESEVSEWMDTLGRPE